MVSYSGECVSKCSCQAPFHVNTVSFRNILGQMYSIFRYIQCSDIYKARYNPYPDIFRLSCDHGQIWSVSVTKLWLYSIWMYSISGYISSSFSNLFQASPNFAYLFFFQIYSNPLIFSSHVFLPIRSQHCSYSTFCVSWVGTRS